MRTQQFQIPALDSYPPSPIVTKPYERTIACIPIYNILNHIPICCKYTFEYQSVRFHNFPRIFVPVINIVLTTNYVNLSSKQFDYKPAAAKLRAPWLSKGLQVCVFMSNTSIQLSSSFLHLSITYIFP